MTARERRAFERLEDELGLFELTVDGVPVWERIRFNVFDSVQREVSGSDSGARSSVDTQAYRKGLALFLRNVWHRNPFLAGEHDVMFVNRTRRQQQADGRWRDVYIDPICEGSDLDFAYFERPYRFQHRTPAETSNRRYLDLVEFGATLQQKLDVNCHPLPASVSDRLDAAATEIDDRFGASVDLTGLARRSFDVRGTKGWLYRRLLRTVDPVLLVLVCSYGQETLIEACQREDVPVVELQHGVIHRSHLGYSYRGSRTKELFPDYLLVWGEYWKHAVEYPVPQDRIIPVGYPHLEQSVRQYDGQGPEQRLLFISQQIIGERLSKFAVAVHEDPAIDAEVVYKLHPKEYDHWRTAYPWLADAPFDVVDGTGPDLYQLFATSRAQVGVYSTAIYEGLHFGLETFLYDCPGVPTLESLLDDGAATLVSSPSELGSAVAELSGGFDPDYYFAPDATTRVREAIERLQADGEPLARD